MEDVQGVLKQIFGPIFESMLKGEMENHLGHKKHERSEDGDNIRNGYSSKTLKTSLGEVPIRVPRERQCTFEPQIIKKHQRGVSSIEGMVLAMYARGMSQRDIAATIEDIYSFQMSHEQISTITDCVTEEVETWRNRPLQPFSPFAFVDCIYVSLRTEYGIQQAAVYVILAYDVNGHKDVMGLWLNEIESKHVWMQIFDEFRARGVKELGILSRDDVSGLEEGARAVYWRCCKGSQCESVSIREDDLKRVAAEAMGLKAFDGDAFRKEVEYIEAGKPNGLVVHFKDGRTAEISYTPPELSGIPRYGEGKADKSGKDSKSYSSYHQPLYGGPD